MPYSEIPDPLPELRSGNYQAYVNIEDFPGSAFTSMSLQVTLGGMPSDQPTTEAMDEWFQSVVDALASIQRVSYLYAEKASSISVNQTITPTPAAGVS